jgi:uncharacterized protein YbjT (DUF2867 family)
MNRGSMRDAPPLLVTGATGYVGGRLAGRLLEAGHRVRVLVRNPARLQGCAWLVQTAIFAPKGGLGLL